MKLMSVRKERNLSAGSKTQLPSPEDGFQALARVATTDISRSFLSNKHSYCTASGYTS